MPLSDSFVKNTKHMGSSTGEKYTDGSGMYLLVKASGKYWRFDYRFLGKRKTLALGVYPAVGVAMARKRRDKARELLAEGVDPGEVKQEEKRVASIAAANTFEVVAREWLGLTEGDRKESTHNKIKAWLVHDVFPYLGTKPIGSVRSRDVLDALRHMEARGALESVQRVKQVCGQVFRYAARTDRADRDVTQDLRGAFKKHKAKNYPAVTSPKEAANLLRLIYSYEGHPLTVFALKLLPMIFVRPGELRHAEWAEFNLDAAEWCIPAVKMKMGVQHLVPLSTQAVVLLRDVHKISGHGKYVFPSVRTGARPMSENTINAALRGLGIEQDVHTAHGFRAMARTIMAEVLHQRIDLIEHQLSHAVKDPNGRAYDRTSFLPERRVIMQLWSDYLDQIRTGSVVA